MPGVSSADWGKGRHPLPVVWACALFCTDSSGVLVLYCLQGGVQFVLLSWTFLLCVLH